MGCSRSRWLTQDFLRVATRTDAVLNHKAGADRAETFKVVKVDEEDRTKVISEPVRFSKFCSLAGSLAFVLRSC